MKIADKQLLAANLLLLARGFMNYMVTAEELESNLTSTFDLISKSGLTDEQLENINKIVKRAESLSKNGE